MFLLFFPLYRMGLHSWKHQIPRASLRRTYGDISQDTLDYRFVWECSHFRNMMISICSSNQPAWPILLYSVAFLHTVVQVLLLIWLQWGLFENVKLASHSVDTVPTFVQQRSTVSKLCCLSGFQVFEPAAFLQREIWKRTNFPFHRKLSKLCVNIPGTEEVWSTGLEHSVRVQQGGLHRQLPVHDEPPRRPRPQEGNLLADRPVHARPGDQEREKSWVNLTSGTIRRSGDRWLWQASALHVHVCLVLSRSSHRWLQVLRRLRNPGLSELGGVHGVHLIAASPGICSRRRTWLWNTITYAQDIPEVFGLHSNADITYQINTAAGILDQILEAKLKMQMQKFYYIMSLYLLKSVI